MTVRKIFKIYYFSLYSLNSKNLLSTNYILWWSKKYSKLIPFFFILLFAKITWAQITFFTVTKILKIYFCSLNSLNCKNLLSTNHILWRSQKYSKFISFLFILLIAKKTLEHKLHFVTFTKIFKIHFFSLYYLNGKNLLSTNYILWRSQKYSNLLFFP